MKKSPTFRAIFLLPALLTALSLNLQARSPHSAPFELSSKCDERGNAEITVEQFRGGHYSLVLEFNVVNMDVERHRRATVDSPGRLLQIRPVDPEKRTSFRYTYQYTLGAINPRRVDRTFVYRLPFSVAEEREARDLVNFTESHWGKDDNAKNFKAFQFMMNRGDTIYAARKGVVIEVEDGHDPITGSGEVEMSTENNSIHVEHADGTIFRYGVLERGSIAVKVGDKVYPDTPLALAGTLDGEIYQLRVSLHYNTDNLDDISSLAEYSVTCNYLDPLFATAEGNTLLVHGSSYTAALSDEMVKCEMTPREIKKRTAPATPSRRRGR